jgi:hypothetical protein
MVSFKRKIFFSPHFSYFPMILCLDFFYQFQIQDLGVTGGREMAQEIIQRSEKGIHDARKIAEAAEKSAEPGGQIGTN